MSNVLRSRYVSVFILAAIAIVLPLFLGTGYELRIMVLVAIFSLSAVGLSLLLGQAGQISLGHGAFMGIGAYAVAIGPAHYGIPPLVSAVLGLVLSCVVAYVIGRPILRLKGYYLAIATLGLSYMMSLFIDSEPAFTNGPDGMYVPYISFGDYQVSGTLTWYCISVIALLIGITLAINLATSPTGRAFRALKDSEIAASVFGVDVSQKKVLAFVVAAGYASVAGSLLALYDNFASPYAAGFMNSLELVTAVVIGGMGSIIGAVVGAAILTVVPQLLADYQNYDTIFIGSIIILFLVFLPQGIVPSLRAKIGKEAKL